MPKNNSQSPIEISPDDLAKRKRYFHATVITCISLALIFGTVHVVKLGANRMEDMRSKAGYKLEEEHAHIRAAGEDIQLQRVHEEQTHASASYTLAEVESLLPHDQWQELATLINVPAGPFIMGTDNVRADIQDQPQHTEMLPAYFIDKYPVTYAQYARFVATTKHRPPLDWENGTFPENKSLHPVVMVSWYDAEAYCEASNKRLPTELEWEKAARGTDARRWPWGNQMDPTRLNTYYNIGMSTEVTRYVQGVSVYGVFDMAGNVSEWTASDFNPYQGSVAPKSLFQPTTIVASQSPKDRAMKVGDLVPIDAGKYKVRRGGSWNSDPFATSTYHRNFSLPHYASDFFGFRCVKNP